MSVNKVILVGNVGHDPELKKNEKSSASTVATFSVATNEEFKDKNGNKDKRTEWHKIVTFGRLAEVCAEHLKKGRQVYVEGSIRSRTYKDKEDKEQKVTEIIASDIKFIGSRPSDTGSETKEIVADVAPDVESKDEIDI